MIWQAHFSKRYLSSLNFDWICQCFHVGSNKVKILYYSDSQCQAYSGYGSGRPSCASYNDSIPFGTTQSYYASVACSAPPAPSPTPAPTVIDAPSGYLITKIYTGGEWFLRRWLDFCIYSNRSDRLHIEVTLSSPFICIKYPMSLGACA